MPFLRPGHRETLASPLPKTSQRRLKSLKRRHVGLLTLCSMSAPSMAHAKPFRAVGVKAWTSGSETFIRARPSAEVPPVAKVKRHTPLYVWGKYNGWYRVETHDHIFGWVFNQYIEAPKNYKVRAMPASKARLASDRTAGQTMYGTPQALKQHYASFRAPGALKGLREHGIRLAVAPKAKLAAKPKTILAKAVVKPATAKPLSAKAASKPPVAKTTLAKPRVRVVGAPRQREVAKPLSASAPRIVSPVPSAERIERRLRVAPVAQSAVVSQPKVRVALRAPQSAQSRVNAPALTRKMGAYTPPRVEALDRNSNPAPREAAPVAREVETAKIAGSARNLTPSAKFFARAASQEALRRNDSPSSTLPGGTPSSAPLTNGNFEPVPFKAPVSIAPVAPRIKISTPAPKRVAKKATKKVARKTSRSRYASRRDRQRQQLRAKMGLATNAPHSVIAPVSSTELMRARQQYLAERKARLGMPSVPAAEVPVVGLAPLPIPNGPLGGPSNTLPPTAPAEFAPMSFEPSHPLAPLLGNPYVLSLAQLKPKNAGALTPVAALKPFPVAVSAAKRGGSPRDRMAMNRGGSPRDRMGSGMASQALSYRGMPYRRGAASPSRGFDCSGLIYFLLRQRGFNPPRTAAGYRNWGQGVAKSQLKSGDLLLFANTYKRGISHIGVYLGNGKFVHAATSSTGVRVSSLNEAYYGGKYYGARRPK